MWTDNDDRIMDILDNIGRENFPAFCPVCGKRAAHLYFHRYKTDDERGGLWIWCSSCRRSSHSSCKVPAWWKNPEMIELKKLSSHPDYLEENKVLIDEWVNLIR